MDLAITLEKQVRAELVREHRDLVKEAEAGMEICKRSMQRLIAHKDLSGIACVDDNDLNFGLLTETLMALEKITTML